MSKVYCNNCKHEHYADCRKWAYEQDTPYRRITWYKSCAIKNKSNDCQDYEPKLFLAIKRKLLDQVDKLAKGLEDA